MSVHPRTRGGFADFTKYLSAGDPDASTPVAVKALPQQRRGAKSAPLRVVVSATVRQADPARAGRQA